jgi:hypothetical protein
MELLVLILLVLAGTRSGFVFAELRRALSLAALKSDLVNLATAEDAYFAEYHIYYDKPDPGSIRHFLRRGNFDSRRGAHGMAGVGHASGDNRSLRRDLRCQWIERGWTGVSLIEAV